MGTVSIANALAFAPNFQKGIVAAGKVFKLLNRRPRIEDPHKPDKHGWVSVFLTVDVLSLVNVNKKR